MAKLSKKNEELLRAVQRQTARVQGAVSEQQTTNTNSQAQQGDTAVGAEAKRSDSAVGLGVDLVEIDRMERAIERTPRIVDRVFTAGEREFAWSKARPAVYYAAFFAARKAVLKALDAEVPGLGFTDIEISYNKKGSPEVLLHGNAQAAANEQDIVEIQISLSNTHQVAAASAVAIKPQSSPLKPEIVDPMAELARQFKELRAILVDLDESHEADVASEETQEPAKPTTACKEDDSSEKDEQEQTQLDFEAQGNRDEHTQAEGEQE